MATPRLKEKYVNEVRDQLFKELGLANVNQIPRLEKIVINMGVGRAAGDKKLLDGAIADLRTITGQQPMVTRAKKSIAGFHLREGQAIGCKVTLRGDRMWDFLAYVTSVVATPTASTVEVTTPWASLSSLSSPRSSTTRSIALVVWTLRS